MDIRQLGVLQILIVFLHFHVHYAYYYPGVVRFENSVCQTLEGYAGTCYRRQQCRDADGILSGDCAGGIGTCCLFQGTCGGTSSLNNTYFINAGYPNTVLGASSCTFQITPCENVCQIRLDFLNLILAQPDGNGNCVTDSLVISGSGGNVPIICGENSGQHMYLSANGNNTISIQITTSALLALSRSWNIKITQIACDCPTQAPVGCLQYYTDLSGTVTSFNYGSTINGNNVLFTNGTSVAGTRQIANQNYGICIYMQPGYCSIQWSQSSDISSFTVSGDTAATQVLVGLPGNGLSGDQCTTDFVVIPNPYNTSGTALNVDRFCGNLFPTLVSSSKPFVLTVITDGNEVTDAANRGFSLDYTQVACSNLAFLIFSK